MNRVRAVALSLALLATQAVASRAQLITSPTGTMNLLINLSGFTGYNFTFGPLTLNNGIVFTANPAGGGNSGQGSVLGSGGYGLGANGSWDGSVSRYAGLDASAGTMRFTFASARASVGGFLNYIPGVSANVWIRALDQNGNLIDQYDIQSLAPISTPGGLNAGGFRGISHGVKDIWAFELEGAFIIGNDFRAAEIPVAIVPEPASMALLGTGLVGLGGVVRRRRKQLES